MYYYKNIIYVTIKIICYYNYYVYINNDKI